MNPNSTRRENTVCCGYHDECDPYLSSGSPSGSALNLVAGTELGRFCIRRKLGQGRRGEVYLANDTVQGRDVAIKVARTVQPGSVDVAWLKYEKAMYDRVHDNKHVLKVNDVFPIQYGGMELLVLSMEWADGGTLRDWLEEHRDDRPSRRRLGRVLVRQLCLGVAALHEAGVAHLDLKPSNLLFVGGVLKVADLGASALVRAGDSPSALLRRWSGSHGEVGTACYASPEYFMGGLEDLDERSDMYSIGVLIYEILSPKARPPFRGNYERLCRLHTSVPAPALGGVTEAEAHVVRRCLEKDPSKRYETITDLLDDLEGMEAHQTEDHSERRVTALWADIRSSVEQGRLTCARAGCRRLLKLDPGHEDAQEMSEQLNGLFEHAGQIYTTIQAKMDSSGLEELIALAIAAANRYRDHPFACAVLIQLEAKATQYSVSMWQGLHALARSDWTAAKESFEKARSYNPGSVAAERTVRFVAGILEQIQESRHLMDVAVGNGAIPQARRLAGDLDEYLLARRDEAVSLLAEIERAGRPDPTGRVERTCCRWDGHSMAPSEPGTPKCPRAPACSRTTDHW